MIFKNLATGDVENETMSGIGVFLFGPFYFLFTGMFLPAFIWFGVLILLGIVLGPKIVVVSLLISLIAAFNANSIVRWQYKRNGWIELDSAGLPLDPSLRTRKCPFCSEQILGTAKKCKHCGSQVDPVDDEDPYSISKAVQVRPAKGDSIQIHIEKICEIYGVQRRNDWFVWEGKEYPLFSDLVNAINESKFESNRKI